MIRHWTGLLVFPAASSPSIRIRISRLANSLFIILLIEPPILHNSLTGVGDVMVFWPGNCGRCEKGENQRVGNWNHVSHTI